MRKIIALSAAGFLATASLPALASSDDVSCGNVSGQQMSVQNIAAKVSGMGYDVRKVERDDGCYEVYATDKNGARVELKLNPVTGEIVKTEKKS